MITEWTIAMWADRETADYVPICRHIGNRVIDAWGRLSGTEGFGGGARRPYKQEDGNPAYIMYEDDANGAVPIIRITEQEDNEDAVE